MGASGKCIEAGNIETTHSVAIVPVGRRVCVHVRVDSVSYGAFNLSSSGGV